MSRKILKIRSRSSRIRSAFTLIELLVVLAIVIILLGVAIPAVKSVMRNNAQSQAVNMVRAVLSSARSLALSQHKQAGVVFFEETTTYSNPANPGQTAMQLMVESSDQSQAGVSTNTTVFVYANAERQYLPAGIRLATLNDASSKQILTGDNSSGGTSRIVLFDSNGQLLLRNGIAHPNVSASATGTYPYAYADWGSYTLNGVVKTDKDWSVTNVNGTASMGISSPGVLVFSMKELEASGSTTDATKATWIQQHSDVLIVNAYTGNIIK